MKLSIRSILGVLKKRKKASIIAGIVIVLLVIVIGRASASKNAGAGFEYYSVKSGNVVQEVDATGKVRAAEGIDFAFETSGKVSSVRVKVGDKVKAGSVLANLKGNDYAASVSQASAGLEAAKSVVNQYQAQLDAQKIKLEEIKKGASADDIQLVQIRIDSAKRSVDEARVSLENAKTKAENDTNQLYLDCANSAASAVNTGLNSLNVITNIQYAHFNGNDMEASILASNKGMAVDSLVGGKDAGRWIFQYINNMNSGARASASLAQSSPNEANSLKALNDVNDALNKIRMTLDVIPFDVNTLSPTEASNITLERANINSQISIITARISSVASQKTANTNLINGAQSALSQAESNLSLAEQEMIIKKSGATSEQIRSQESTVKQAEAALATQKAQVRSAQASLASASAMYSKTVLTSTITGTVTKINVRAGEIASAMTPAISVISDSKFEIETNIPEADIAKVKTGDSAKVTLDAYGSDVFFETRVVKIDLAETIIDGVSTYKVTLEFVNEDDRTKPGLTANITILTATKENVLTIPQRSLIRKDGKIFVLVSDDGKKTNEVEVEVGLVGSEGDVEVLSGLNEGGKIVNLSSVKK